MNTSPSQPPVLRVLQIASGDLWAGAEVQFYTLCAELAEQPRVDLQVVLLNDGELAKRLVAKGIAVTIFDESQLSFVAIAKALLAHCRAQRPDIIHSHRSKENVLAGLCRALLGIRSVRTQHGAAEFSVRRFSPQHFSRLADRWVGRFLQSAVVAVSRDLQEKLLSSFPPQCLRLIENGVASASSAAQPVAASISESVSEVKTLGDGYHIGFVGRLVPVKRVDLFIDIAEAIQNKVLQDTALQDTALQSEAAQDKQGAWLGDKPLHFWIIGDGPLRESLEAQAAATALGDTLHFVGHVSNAVPYIAALDVLLMCSDHEGTPMTVLESWREATPVLAHDVGGLRELLQNNCGVLVAGQRADDYADELIQLLSSPQRRHEIAVAAQQRLSQRYSAARNCEAYLSLYRQVLDA